MKTRRWWESAAKREGAREADAPLIGPVFSPVAVLRPTFLPLKHIFPVLWILSIINIHFPYFSTLIFIHLLPLQFLFEFSDFCEELLFILLFLNNCEDYAKFCLFPLNFHTKWWNISCLRKHCIAFRRVDKFENRIIFLLIFCNFNLKLH